MTEERLDTPLAPEHGCSGPAKSSARTGWRIALFVVATSFAFVYICNAIPQIKAEPVKVKSEIGTSPEDLIAAGKEIFTSDRGCFMCHSIEEDPKARCPIQGEGNPEGGVGFRAARRKPGMSAAEYLVESVYDPNAYIVSGYPKNQMRPVNKPPIALSHEQILAVIAFLNTLGGKTDEAFLEEVRKAQDPWRRGLRKPDEGVVQSYRPPVLPGDATRGRAVLDEQRCLDCHRIGKEGRDVCPDLSSIGAAQSPDYLIESLLQPSAVIVKGYRESIVIWKDDSEEDLRGRVLRWVPDHDRAQRVVLWINDLGKWKEREVDLGGVAWIGDAVVLRKDGDRVAGDLVEGNEKSGVELKVLQDGRWAKRTIAPTDIDIMFPPASPMPADFAEKLTPRQLYDLVAYLVERKRAE